jgi:hypothetical protein
VRVPTWLPCRLQIYFNGHNWLAARLRKQKIDFTLLDNAFVQVPCLFEWSDSAIIKCPMQVTAVDFLCLRLHGDRTTFHRYPPGGGTFPDDLGCYFST